ncbi:MAG: PQQ-dependent sugar dehydrogenase [Candidatus Nanopelagicales bacterium]
MSQQTRPRATRPARASLATVALVGAALAAGVLPATSAVASPTAPASGTASVGVRLAPAAVPALNRLRVTATKVVGGLRNPVLVRSAPDRSTRLYVVEQAGRVRLYKKGKIRGTYLDIRGLVNAGGEQGMLGLAFAPDFARSRYLFVTYTRGDGALVLARFRAATASARRVSATTRKTILVVPHPGASNHNGGNIDFGPDGMLYLGTGDGGQGGDPPNNAQDKRSLLGKMLRIDVRCSAATYCIPAGNPYASSSTDRREIWMVGLRNPWRFSFDTDGTQWVADVGQDAYEEVTAVRRSQAAGANLGWSCREGRHAYDTDRCAQGTTYLTPQLELCHPSIGGCAATRSGESVIGGYVYRGRKHPAGVGTYVLADFITGYLWPARGSTLGTPSRLAGVTGFGLSDAREIYATTYGGGLYRIGFRTV